MLPVKEYIYFLMLKRNMKRERGVSEHFDLGKIMLIFSLIIFI